MKFISKLIKHKIIIGVCLLVASVTALTAILVPAYTKSLKSNDDSQVNVATDPVSEVSLAEPKEAFEIAPNHDYSSVIANMNSGAKIYVGITTASDLKNNLNVTGTFNSGDTSVSANLKKNEYTLQVSIGSFVKDLSENDVILDALPGDSDQVNIIVKVKRNSGEVTSSFAIPVASIAEGEEFEAFEAVTSITVENVASITNDFDKEALKNILVVKDNTGKVIQNKELYDVTFLGNLVPGNGATFQVTYKAGDTTLPPVTGTIGSVTQAQIIAADFSVNPNYRLDGMYYKKQSTEEGESDKWFSAFVAGSAGISGSTLEDIYGDGLKLTVHYPNSSRILSFSSFGENSSTADTNEYVVFNTTSFVENANDITASVYNHIGGQSVNVSISINFELAKIVEIKADGYNRDIDGLVSSKIPDETLFVQDMESNISYVKTRANTGVWSATHLTTSGYSVRGTLTPTADVIAQAATMTPDQLASFKYKKEVTIIYNDDKSITTTYEVDVLYEEPSSVYRVNTKDNKFPNQTMRTPFDFGDLYVVLQYGEDGDIDIEVPLTEFLDANGNSEHIRIELYSDTARTQLINDANGGIYIGETPIITKEVQGIKVSFRYDISGSWCTRAASGSRPGMSVAKYVVSLPTFDTRTISFSTNSTKSIVFNSSIEQEILNGLELGVYNDENYTDLTTEFAEYNQTGLAVSNEIKFLAGGKKYYIELRISDELKDEVEWSNGDGVSGNVVRYVVEISKGPITPVVVSYGTGTWVYGDTPETPTITGTRVDGSSLNVVYGTGETDISSSQLEAEYEIRYYLKTQAGFDSNYLTDTLPVGEYYVQVLIPDTTNYLEAISTPGPGYGCPTIKVTKAPLSPNNLLPNITFDGVSRDGDDFVTGATGIKYSDTGVIEAGSLTSLTSGISLTSDNKALHAGSYSVKLTIAAAYKDNYKWADDVTVNSADNSVTKEFQIYKRVLGYDITNESTLGFTYGDSTLPTPTFGYSDNYDATTSPTLSAIKPSLFFAVEGTVKYYNSSNTEVLASDFAKWPIGTYTVKCELSEASGHLKSDYTLPTASATFEVSQKGIDLIADVSVSSTYTGSAWNYTIIGWDPNNDNNGDPILTGTLVGSPFDSEGNLNTAITNLNDYDTAFNAATGVISILHAGEYKFTITLNSNYKWNVAEGESAPETDPTITLTMSQKVLAGNLSSASTTSDDYEWDSNSFEFDPESTTGQDTPTITMKGVALADNIQLNYTLHYTSDNTEVTNKATMIAADYYYLLTNWTGDTTASGYDLAKNYRFPTDKKIVTFTVQSSALEDVALAATLSGIYKGSDYDFTSFITNLSDFLYGTSNTSKLVYYVQSSSSNNSNATSLDGVMSPLMTDTGSYTIYIYPAANFAWENAKAAFGATAPASIQDKTGYVVTFTITAKPLAESDINWGTTTFTYNGEEQAAKPTINASSLLNTADTDVKLADIQITAGTSTGTTAGKYTATLDGFISTSTRAFNYTIGSFTKEITINPFELDAPTMSSKTGTFNGKNQDLTVTLPTASSVKDYNANALITGTVLGGWEAVGATAHQASYTAGKFTFLNAGTYQITFALTDTQNYKWKSGTAPVISDINISRMEIVAPALGNNRTMEHDGSAKYPIDGSCFVTINNTQYSVTIGGNTASVTVDGHTITWSVHYASYEGNFDYVTESVEPTDHGTYYIQFNIFDGTNQSHLNYEWVRNDSDKDKLDFMQELYGITKQSAEDGTALFLAYMITRKLFQPKLEALNSGKYIFGDNGLAGTYTQDGDLSKAANFIHLAASTDTTTVLAANPTITCQIYSLTSLNSNFELVEAALLSESDLVNGLPWNKGYYGMYVYIDFTNDGETVTQYENIRLKYAFEVQAREVTITWSAVDGSGVTANESIWEMTYTSNTYNPADLLAAEVTNLAKKSTTDTPVAPTMTITANPTTIKDAKTYTFSVTITGTDVNSKNYTVKAGETSVTTSLKINPVTLDLEGVAEFTTFVYGTTPTLTGTDWWTYAAGSATICSNDTAADIVSYEIVNAGSKYPIGTYDVVVKLASGITNYVLSEDTASAKGSVEVVAREITLVLDASDGKTTSVYQKNAVTLGTPYSVTYDGTANSINWLVSGDTLADIFSLKLLSGTEDVTNKEYNPVGTYSIEVIKGTDTNYVVNVSTSKLVDEEDHATLGDYTITNATLSVDDILGNVDAGVTITYDANPYDWIKAIEDQTRASLITYEGLNGVNLDNNNVVWTITKKNSSDTVSGTAINAFAQTTYVVTVSADNHTATTGVEVVVEIEKAVLTISVNFNTGSDRIYYGEELPTVDTEGYDDLSTAIYKIVGLKGSDTPSVISGSFSFTSSDYEVWEAVGAYTTTIDVSNLTSANYTFNAAEGAITVIPLPLTITLPSLTNVYIQDVASMEATDNLVVEAFADLYDMLTVEIRGQSVKDRVSQYLQNGKTILDIVNLMTEALIQDVDGNITATNDVNVYPFYLVAAEDGIYSNYNITVSATANSLTVPSGAVNNKTAAFTITAAENKFTDVFGFAGVDPLTTTVEGIIAAWVYGVNDDGYNTTTHQINLPVTKFNSVPGSTDKNNAIIYKLYYLSGSDWIQLGSDSQDIVALFTEQLAAGNFNATSYKVEYILEGNDNYSDISDVRYFEVTPRDLYIWAKDAKTYYGEDFVRDVLTSGLVDNGSGTTDTLTEVATLEYVHTYVAGTTNAGKAYYTLQEKTQGSKYSNYVLHWNYKALDEEVSGEIDVLPRPVEITITSRSSQYNFDNKQPSEAETTLYFNAKLGTNELGIEFATTNPFYGITRTQQFTNANNDFVTLYTNALLNGDIKTQNVGNYAIFAVYKNDLAKQNYAITVSTEYSRDEALEDIVNDYFTTEGNPYDFYSTYIDGYYNTLDADLMISVKDEDNYKAGTYRITASNLTLSITLPDQTYNGERKTVTLTGDVPADPFGLVSFRAQYDYNYGKGESLYMDEAPVNVGTYPIRVIVENPNYIFNAGGLSNAVRIIKRELDWNASINEANNLSKSTTYGDANTMYLGAGNVNQLDIMFSNICTNSSVTEESGLDARLNFSMTMSGKAVSGTTITAAYGEDFVLYDYDINTATYTLFAQHSGIYTITLKLEGTEAQNYAFPSAYLKAGTTDTYEFTFTINRSNKAATVGAQNTLVQYGTPITANGSTTNPNLFGGFKLDANTIALIDAENDQLADTSDASKVTYTATLSTNQSVTYNPATAQARTSYQIRPDGLWFYNYDITYNRNAVMTVNPRKIVVLVAGAESSNSYASVIYSGTEEGPDHSEVAASHAYFVPQDLEGGIKWYGEAGADKDKNYGDLFNYYLNLFAGAHSNVNGGKGVEADTYYIKINGTAGLTNYEVTFQNKAGDVLTTEDTNDEIAPTYVIQKKSLTVQVGSTGLNNTDAFATSFTIPYGNTLIKSDSTYYYLTGEYYGLVDRDNTTAFINANNAKLKFTSHKVSGNGTDSYLPWDSHAGSKYEIRPVEFDFANYEVTAWNSATMEVVSRLVTATTADRTYTEYRANGVINYQLGQQGAYHAAQIVFADYDARLYNTNGTEKYYTGNIQKDTYGVILNGIITDYAPKYTMSYTNADSYSDNISAQGPRMVGKYNATVSMTSNNGNYDYLVVSKGSTSGSSSTTLSYAVNKKQLTINWNTVSSDYLNYNTGDDKQREILNYITEIMSVTQITRQFTNSSAEQEVEYILEALGLSDFGAQSYYIDSTNAKVLIKIYGIGLYTATISISPTAVRNYVWRDSSGASGTEFTLAFRVAADSITIDSLTLGNGVWSYGENAPLADFTTNVDGVGLLYKYASINSIPDTYEFPTLGTMIVDSDLTTYLDKNNLGYSMTMPTDAGLYVMYAWYPGSDQYQMAEAFLVFEIEKAILQTPDVINSELEFKDENGKKVIEMTYTGDVLQLELGYDTKLLNINYAGNMNVPSSGMGMILLATDVNDEGYAVSFSLSDSANYAWDLESFGEFVWKVVPAEDNTIESFDFDELLAGLTYGESYSDPTASATYSNDIIIEYFVNDAWVTTRPDQAGTYKVRAVSPATKNYYSGSKDQPAISDEITFTIEKKELYVRASGSMTYGDEFSITGGYAYSYQFTGFINNDTASKVSVDQIEYMLIDAPTRLEVGGYKIQLAEAEGEVIGMTADNYKIIAEEGDFTVNKRDVMVVLGVASSVYGEKVDLSKVSMDIVGTNQLVPGDEFKDLNIQLAINSTDFDIDSIYNQAASYKVDAEGHATSKNYNVTVYGSGVYTITPLSIYITIEAGGGVYQGTITAVELTGIYTTDGDHSLYDLINEDNLPGFTFNYWGTSNDGTWTHTNADRYSSAPYLAGNYYASAVSSQSNNYRLDTTKGNPSVSFVVEKKILDDTNREVLFANPMEYTGSVVMPVITDLAFEGLYNTGATNYETVGSYTIPLTLKDSANYKWASVDNATCEIPFEIVRSNNAFEGEVSIQDWVYGNYDADKNLPTANTKFGTSDDFTYSYSDKEDGTYTTNIPTNAGTYWVKITAPQTDNYYSVTSDAKEFHITKATVTAPTLVIVSDGANQNTVYTGSRLQAEINGYNSSTMRMVYDGDSSFGNSVAIFALNADTYVVKFVLNDSTNYAWAEGTTLVEGDATLSWSVARKQIAKPTMNTKTYMVNGSTLTFTPNGFDEETMNIEGNKTSYGGSFKVTVSIKDKTNFEWADSTTDDVVFDWFVVGWDTVFIIVLSVLGVVAGIAAIAIVIQYVLHRRKKKRELEDELAAQGLFDENMDLMKETEAQAKKPTDGGNNNE